VAKPGRKAKPALEYPECRRLLTIIRSKPGIGFNELAEAFGRGVGDAYYNLDKLTREGYVRTEKNPADARRVHYFVTDRDVPPAPAESLATRTGDTSRWISLVITMNPGLTLQDVVRLSGVNARTVYHHVLRLEADGLVTTSSQTRYRGLAPTPKLYAELGLPQPGVPQRSNA
jgi:DNA-binding MarR family transcriptional regulator